VAATMQLSRPGMTEGQTGIKKKEKPGRFLECLIEL